MATFEQQYKKIEDKGKFVIATDPTRLRMVYTEQELDNLRKLQEATPWLRCGKKGPKGQHHCTCKAGHEHGHVAHALNGAVLATWPNTEAERVTVRLIVQVTAEGRESTHEALEYIADFEELDEVTWSNGPVSFVTRNAVKQFRVVNGFEEGRIK